MALNQDVLNAKETQIPPVDAPESFRRRLQFPRFQLVGIALLLAVPVLALLGVFGPSSSTVIETVPGLHMQVEYPVRFRYKTVSSLEASFTNTSTSTIPLLTVAFDQSYISRFSNVQLTPSPESVTGTGYRVKLNNIGPGEIRRVAVSLQGERYGLHQGSVQAFTAKQPLLRVPFSTFVFP